MNCQNCKSMINEGDGVCRSCGERASAATRVRFGRSLKKIATGIMALGLLFSIGWLVYYYTRPVPIVVKFGADVSAENAMEIVGKYQTGLQERERFEYDNPFFSFLYPFSKSRGVSVETIRIRAQSLGEEIKKEPGVDEVIVLENSYAEAREYKTFFETLNP